MTKDIASALMMRNVRLYMMLQWQCVAAMTAKATEYSSIKRQQHDIVIAGINTCSTIIHVPSIMQ